jgi:hypothetical protein
LLVEEFGYWGKHMGGLKTPTILAIILFFGISLFVISVEGGPAEVVGEIQVQGEYLVVLNEDQVMNYEVEGFFAVTSKTGLDALGGTYATMTVSEGGWDPGLSPSRWDSVQQNENYDFTVSLTIPNGTGVGEQNAYTLILTFYNSFDQEVGSDTAGFSVRVENVIPSGDDDDDSSDDDDVISPVEDESFPLWPFFIGGIVIGLIIIGIWGRKNLEFVRDEDGSRRVMLREKDTGHILGRKKQPPPESEIDL